MNKKISGAKLVLVPITHLGKNYFPFVEDLKARYIKYIDFVKTSYLPDTADAGVGGFLPGTAYITLANEIGNRLLFNNAPIELFDYAITKGIRQPIGAKLSLQNCFVDCQDPNCIGKKMALIFYYDLPEFSARNKSDNLITDSVSVPIVTDTFHNSFPDVERMSGKRFRFIQFSPVTTTPEMEPGVLSGFENLYITLRKGSYNVIENIPLYVLYQVIRYDKIEFANIVFDFQSSFITVGGAGTYTPSFIGKSVFLNLTYEM